MQANKCFFAKVQSLCETEADFNNKKLFFHSSKAEEHNFYPLRFLPPVILNFFAALSLHPLCVLLLMYLMYLMRSTVFCSIPLQQYGLFPQDRKGLLSSQNFRFPEAVPKPVPSGYIRFRTSIHHFSSDRKPHRKQSPDKNPVRPRRRPEPP